MSSGSTTPRPSLSVLFSVIVVDLVSFGIVVPILPFWAERYGASGFMLGVILASHALMQFLLAPTWGRISDRIGRRPVMLLTIAGTALSLVGLGFADSLFQIFLARVAAGIFGANISVATAYLTDVTEESERTRWMGMVGASFAVGFTLGPPIGGLLARVSHGAPMFFAAGLAVVNLVWAALRLVEPERREAAATAEAVIPMRNRFQALRNDAVRRICLVYFLYSLAVTQLETVFAYFMLERFGYRELGVAMLMFAMAVLMGGIQGGAMKKLAQLFPERSLALTGLTVMILGFACLPFVDSVGVLLVPLTLLALARAIAQPPLMSLVSLHAEVADRGIVMGVFQSSASGARIVGPLIAGALYDRSPGWPFWMAALLAAAAASLALGLRRPREVANGPIAAPHPT
jgi:DHA1 family tetracycline resistance protein-like MFS transporter